jgi:hypothetical protein
MATRPTTAAPSSTASAKRAPAAVGGLVLPRTYQEACARQGATCLPGASGILPEALNRPMHLPTLRTGQHCPSDAGERVDAGGFGGIALGSGTVRVIVASEGDLSRRVAVLNRPTPDGWLTLKTLWFSVPTYTGPFVVRVARLDGQGQMGLGEPRIEGPLVVPPGPTLNGSDGYRTSPGSLWVKTPGCYGWQVDGLTFSETVVVQTVTPT